MQGANSSVSYQPSIIVKTIIDDEEYEQPLEVAASREAYLQTLARTAYEFVPEVISCSGTSITMRRVKGATLEDYILSKPTTKEYVGLYNKIKIIVRSLSSVGVYHKDIVPENLIVDSTGNVWLIDFGRARLVCENEDKDQILEDELFMYRDVVDDLLIDQGYGHIIPPMYM